MLRLRTQATQRIGKPYICRSCLVSIRSPFASGLQASYHGQRRRAFSSIPRRNSPATEISKPASPDLPVKPSKKKKRSSHKASEKDASPRPTSPQKPSHAERQLKVLEGAVLALKNVLSAQNINVDDIVKPKRRSTSQKDEKLENIGESLESIAVDGTATRSAEVRASQSPTLEEKTKKGKSTQVPKRPDKGEVLLRKVKSSPQHLDRETLQRKFRDQPQPLSLRDLRKTAAPQSPPARLAMSSRLPPLSRVGYQLPIREVASDLPFRNDLTTLELRKPRRLPEFNKIKDTQPTEVEMPKPPKKLTQIPMRDLEINRIHSDDLQLVPIEKSQPPVPSVSYGLDRVLFNPGVYHLQDPRSKVYNFDPYLQKIMPIHEFDFNALTQYVTSSKDETLISVAREHNKKYTGSTSSMTSVLSHFHYLLSSWREINSEMMSKEFEVTTTQFTRFMRAPAAMFLHWKDGVYAIDADKEFDTATILSMLGKSMEKLLTLPKEEYERYRHVNSDEITEEERNASEAYHYTGLGDFMMRSQLDAHDPRIPGTGMFDLKTRAVVSIRMDAQGFQKGVGYEIRQRNGNWQSYEREYHDMIRAAFLKYSLQVRMGRMDGIFVAYHNTNRIFGFQYVPLEEMDLGIHGTKNLALGDKEFKLSLGLLNEVLDRATKRFPEQSLRLHFETRASVKTPFMYIFAHPVGPGDIEAVQNASKEAVEAFESNVLGLKKEPYAAAMTDAEALIDAESVTKAPALADAMTVDNDNILSEDKFDEDGPTETQDTEGDASWEEMRLVVEDAMEDDELGVAAVREAIEDALEESGLLEAQSPEEAGAYVNALLSAVTGGHTDASGTWIEGSESSELDTGHDDDLTMIESASFGISEPLEEQLVDGIDGEVKAVDESVAIAQPDARQKLEMVPEGETDMKYRSESEASSEQESEMSSGTDLSTSTQSGEAEYEQDGMEPELEGEHGTKDEVSSSPSMSTLRNLILRMTRRIEEKRLSEEQQQIADDSSKLQEFERILGKMVARSRADSDEEQSSMSTPSSPASDLDASADPSHDTSEKLAHGNGRKPNSPPSSEEAAVGSEFRDELLGFVLTIRNKVNDHYVTRPDDLKETDRWTLEYNMEELPNTRAQNLYAMCQKRRKTIYSSTDDRDAQWGEMFKGDLKKYTKMGRRFRKTEDEEAKKRPVFTVGEEGSRTYEEVFGAEAADTQNQD